MCSNLSCYQLKLDCYIYRSLHVNVMVTTKNIYIYTVDTQKMRMESKHNTKEIHQTTMEDSLVHILSDLYSVLLHANMHVEIDKVGVFSNRNNTA